MQTIEETRAYFDERAEIWDSICRHDPEKIAAIVTLGGLLPGARVLDIACGTGVLFGELLQREPKEILGVDLSGRMLQMAAKKYDDPRLRLRAGDVLTLQESGFDCAFLYSAYPHFPDKRALTGHVAGLLKTGGRLIIAHSESRQTINARHAGSAQAVSECLGPASIEAQALFDFFAVDILIDTPQMYVIAGEKRA